MFREFYETIFLVELTRKRVKYQYQGPALLILDNLLAHKKIIGCPIEKDYIFLAPYNLHVLFLVPHSSNQTQPLDLGIFGIQKGYSQNIRNIKNLSPYSNMLNKAIKSMQQASTTDNIIKAFAAAGIVRTLKYDERSRCVKIALIVNRNRCIAVEHIEHEPDNDQYSSTRVPL